MKKILQKLSTLWAFLFYCLCAVGFTWPLTLHLKTHIIGGMGDNIYFVWLVRWYQKAFLEGGGHPFFAPHLNYPQGWNLSTTETSLTSTLPGVPFSLLWGPIAGYNLAMLLTFVLAGFFMYLWIKDLTRSNTAALLAGFLFSFSPYHISHFVVGHLNLCGIQWFPLFFWGLQRLLRADKRFDLKFALLSGLSLAAIAFTSMYYLYMSLIFGVLFGLLMLLFTRFAAFKNKHFWLNLGLALLVSLPFLFYALRPFINLAQAGTLASRPIEYAAMYSASPTDFILPATDHFLWGAAANRGFDRSLWNESSLYLGCVTLILAVAPLIRNKKSQHRPLIWSAFILVLISLLLALGINLHWNNQPVTWHLPAFLQPLFNKSETLVYLPAAWLFNHLPFFDKMRTIMRFAVFALFLLPLLAGLGVQLLETRLTRGWRAAIAVALFALAFLDLYPGTYAANLTCPAPRAVDAWLAQQPGSGAVVQLPIQESSDQAQVYYTLFHQKPFLGGDFNANQPQQWTEIQPVLAAFPDEHSIQRLQLLGVEFMVVDQAAYADDPTFVQTIDQYGLILLTEQDGQAVYTFSAP